MADTVTTTLIENGPRNWVYRFTSVSDGTGEAGVVKVDGSAAGPLGVNVAGQISYPGIHLKIREIDYDVQNMSVRLLWDATVPVDAVILGQGADRLRFDRFGGITIPPGLAGATGRILFTTLLPLVDASYTVVIRGTKGVPQS